MQSRSFLLVSYRIVLSSSLSLNILFLWFLYFSKFDITITLASDNYYSTYVLVRFFFILLIFFFFKSSFIYLQKLNSGVSCIYIEKNHLFIIIAWIIIFLLFIYDFCIFCIYSNLITADAGVTLNNLNCRRRRLENLLIFCCESLFCRFVCHNYHSGDNW